MIVPRKRVSQTSFALPVIFLAGRLVLLIALPLEGLRGFGDLNHFYRLAGMGIPYLDYWVEFPPVFPFLSRALYGLAGGREHVYDYLLVLLLTLAQAGSLGLFLRLSSRLRPQHEGTNRNLIYFAILLVLSYGWWYFDPLAVFSLLLGLYWLVEGKDIPAGIALAIGTLTKLFPVLVLAAVWRFRKPRQALRISALTIGITALVYGGLYLASPQMTSASLRSQVSKGSWETSWALLDGNLNTGNFGPLVERFDPSTAQILRGNPPRIPSWLTLLPFAALGAWLFWRARLDTPLASVAFLGLTWSIFLIWSPGWSPQWVLYLLPLVLLALPERQGLLLAATLVFVNLLEWPVLLSRGYNWGLWLTVPLRTLLFALLAMEFWQVIRNPSLLDKVSEVI